MQGTDSNRTESGNESALRGEATKFASAARHRVKEEVRRQRENITGSVGDFADAMRRAADELKSRDQTAVAHLLGEAALGLESVSRTLEQTEPEDALRQMKDFGRRHPATFIVGSMALGLVAARFMRSSERRNRRKRPITPATGVYSATTAAPVVDSPAAATPSTIDTSTFTSP